MERQGDSAAGTRRIEFEEQQVSEEREELRKLVKELDQGLKALSIQIANINHRISAETRTVAAAQSLAVRAVPPDIALLDQETGWAQVNGRNALTWEEKFDLDLWYVANHSLWVDLKILAMTAWKVIRREGIQHPGQVIMEEFKGYRN